MNTLSEMLKVQVEFNQSHLLFPSLVQWLLLVLLALIAIVCILVITALGTKVGQTFDSAQTNLPAGGGQVEPTVP